MNYYLGVDAGGSKTHALIVNDQGHLQGRGDTGNGNHQTGLQQAEENIALACRLALEEAKLTPKDIHFAYFGLAGADREPDFEILRPMIGSLGFPRHKIACDTMIAMRAGTSRSYGAVIISGTGFNAAARNSAGEELQYGGFGYLFGDGQGSGRSLADFAFRSAIRAWDGRGRPTILQQMVLDTTEFADVPAMLDAALDDRFSPPLHLAELVFKAAQLGDALSIDYLLEEGREHANAVGALIRRLGMEEEAFEVVLGGSVLAKSMNNPMIDAITEELGRIAPKASIVRITMDPVMGAILSAMDADNQPASDEVMATLQNITVSDQKGEIVHE
ncbi:N-acetylglucosamine kinase-like BadF-type ATPase [Paenibacillus shirakamiensis]|uniref:N-acetylglucosamine kinase-like BadF-type ATPase n=1 Tax=Paenibacillus shirakamiensis TaxID=1265935 RepID=A0ABS4JK33_9BACL|nr:BadF/BadG/BcrA/BcrD ATPase family protein [Paenibacillus shirakamiensis]MBP2001341.1 N-acetylglucosamine kinase-like BadF-type ATPase [Paenibacillus shirakamiensis]